MAAEESDVQRVAVVGAGIAGLASALLLKKQGKQVTLFESEDRCGGHALTVDTEEFGPIDLGFQVCNLSTYPHLMGMLRTLGVDTEPSDMSFALSTPALEWGSRGLASVFCEPGSTRSPRFLRMVWEVVRFGRVAPEVLEPGSKYASVTLGEYLSRRGFSKFFQDHYVIPMCAAIWSCSNGDALAFPVVSLVHFWRNHHLLEVLERPTWRVLKGRSRAYVGAVVALLDDVRTSTKVVAVQRREDGAVSVQVEGAARPEAFDAVVMATHSDVTLKILHSTLSDDERSALSAVKYQANDVYLHTDLALMPRNRAAWASWNCIQAAPTADEERGSVCVSYWVNLLQNLPPGARDVIVTLNPRTPPEPSSVLAKFSLAHPLLNTEAIAAQQRLGGDLQGVGGVYYAGAWCGYGFHEDGIRSAVSAVSHLCGGGAVTPWAPVSCDPKMALSDRVFHSLFRRFGVALLPKHCAIRMVLPDGSETMIGAADAPPADLATIRVRDVAFFGKVVRRSDIGLGEAYMDGDFEPDDLYHFLDLLCRQSCGEEAKAATYSALGVLGGMLHKAYERIEIAAHHRNANTEEGSARNIAYHYDAGNDFYKLFLDATMLYSSGIHPGLLQPLAGLSFEQKEARLEQAQYAKIDAMIARAQLKPGDHVLEIGCGWGACAIRMAQAVGCRVTGITVSNEQLVEARARVKAAGVSHLVELSFCDYRKVEGTYDKVVSIEMLEAVGHEHLPSFFEVVSRALKPGGIAAVQVITLPDDRYEAYCSQHSDFIRTYIFPGGHLPSLGAMVAISSKLGLELDGCADLGEDYAVTLRLWRERMLARRDAIRALGYPERFIRMYEFYFVYCEAGFANLLIHDYQIAWRKTRTLPPIAAATSALAPRAAATDSAPSDPLTCLLLSVWCALLLAVVGAKAHMGIIPASLGAHYLIGSFLRLVWPRAAPASASKLTALIAAVLTSAGSLALLAHAAYLGDLTSAASLRTLLLSPHTEPAYLLTARLAVGASAGFSALRAWECIHAKRLDYWEAATYTAQLVCATSALHHSRFLFALSLAQVCEGHTALLRLRSLGLHASRSPSDALWRLSWLAYASLRVVPHAALLLLFTANIGRLYAAQPASATLALAGLLQMLLNNAVLGWAMLRAQRADARTVTIESAADSRPVEAAAATAGGADGRATPHTPIPFSLRCTLGSVLVAAACGWATAQQEAPCAALVGGTSVAYGALYGLMRATGWMQPPSGALTPVLSAEWRSRTLSTINAILLIGGSLACFSEWPSYTGSEAFISNHLWSHPVTFAALFVGYLQWDLFWCVKNYHVNGDWGALLHHSLFIAITHYVLWGWYFKKPFAWLSLTELSTPFLNIRWMLAVRGPSPWPEWSPFAPACGGAELKATRAYSVASFGFALTFLATRAVGYGLGLADLWANVALWLPAKRGLYFVIAGVHVGFGLNLMWGVTVAANLRKALTKGAAKLDAKVDSKLD